MSIQLDMFENYDTLTPSPEKRTTKMSHSESLGCLHVALWSCNHHEFMASPSNRQIIWWLCLKTYDCTMCYKRLNPLPTPEDMTNAKIRKQRSKNSST